MTDPTDPQPNPRRRAAPKPSPRPSPSTRPPEANQSLRKEHPPLASEDFTPETERTPLSETKEPTPDLSGSVGRPKKRDAVAGAKSPVAPKRTDVVARWLRRHEALVLGANLVALVCTLGLGGLLYFSWDRPRIAEPVRPQLAQMMEIDDIDAVNGGELGAKGGPAAMIKNKILVSFNEGVNRSQIDELARSLGISFNVPYDGAPNIVTAVIDPAQRDSLLSQLNGNPLVHAAEPDFVYWAQMVPNDKGYSMQWNLHMLNMETAWDYSKGSNTVVAVLDTGVMIRKGPRSMVVEDLANTASVQGYDFAYGDSDPEDIDGHGTHVAGTIAQSTDNGLGVAGIAFKATIMPVKVLGNNGSGELAAIISGVRYAADNGAHIINMSLGSPRFSQIFDDAIQYAYQKGVTVVCAAGNSGENEVLYPAGYNHVIAVSAVDRNNNLAGYSTYGFHVEIAAPGGVTDVVSQGGFLPRIDFLKDLVQGKTTGIIQNTVFVNRQDRRNPRLDQGYRSFQGTSMASPHVAGVAALIHSLGVTNPPDIRAVLRQTAFRMDPPEKYGAGVLDAGAAVKAVAGRNAAPKQQFTALLLIAGGIAALILARNGLARIADYIPEAAGVAAGIFLPDILGKQFGLSTYGSLVVHSVAIPALVVLLVPQFHLLARICSMAAAGVAVTIFLAHKSSSSLIPVLDIRQTQAWLVANLAFAGLVMVFYWMNRQKWMGRTA